MLKKINVKTCTNMLDYHRIKKNTHTTTVNKKIRITV